LNAAVREAGALALSMFGTSVKSWTKGQGSPVTAADIAANDLLRERLAAAAPAIAWLSEESPDDEARRTARRVWVVDPIDGTRAYIAGRTDWAVSVALVEDGRPVAGALFAPAEPAFYAAVAGKRGDARWRADRGDRRRLSRRHTRRRPEILPRAALHHRASL
jgi:myo-inositol-1(or 4)-monophosphatase